MFSDGRTDERKLNLDFGIPDPHPMDCTRLFAQVDRKCVAPEGTRRILSSKYLGKV